MRHKNDHYLLFYRNKKIYQFLHTHLIMNFSNNDCVVKTLHTLKLIFDPA